MKLIIYFLLLSSLSILIRAENLDDIKKAVEETIERTKDTNSTGVKFHVGGYLGKGQHSIVWKGDYNGQTVAFKLIKYYMFYQNEIEAYLHLFAINNPNVEKHGIPNIHISGEILASYWGIGMTLLEENLEERWEMQNRNISELSILLIFKRGVEILEYLNERKVLHNDIKPTNIFLRGSEVFFGDFNAAAGDGMEDIFLGHTLMFASSGYYAQKVRTPMDDLESLVFSLWSVAGIECDKVYSSCTEPQPEGETLDNCKKNGTAESKMIAKCNGFKNKHVQKACQLIAADEMLKEKRAPDYKRMRSFLEKAIKKVHKGKSTPQFEWLAAQSPPRV